MRTVAGLGSVLFAAFLAGCGAGGSGGSGTKSSAPAAPSIDVLPTSFNFGTVTLGNTPAPLEVTVRNAGGSPLAISSVALGGASASSFALDFAAGTRPCASSTPSLQGGQSCTFRVAFRPAGTGTFSSEVRISSNDARAPTSTIAVTGLVEAQAALAVRINQIETACPGSNATAYVSVVDQGRYSVPGLSNGNFTLTEGLPPSANLLLGAVTVGNAYKPIAIAAVVDNSGSVTTQTVAYADVKNGFASLFNGFRGNDVGALINFATEYETTVPFPSPSSTSNATNKAQVAAAIAQPWASGNDTLLFDSVYAAIDQTARQTAYRRAVIVATDGNDARGETGTPASTHTLADVIAYGLSKQVPVFAIGIGESVAGSVLEEMTYRTGGFYYRAPTSQNLATIYQQLSSLLFRDQYVLTFNQLALGQGVGAPLTVNVVGPTGITGADERTITSCN
jgi:hypothetical protein